MSATIVHSHYMLSWSVQGRFLFHGYCESIQDRVGLTKVQVFQ